MGRNNDIALSTETASLQVANYFYGNHWRKPNSFCPTRSTNATQSILSSMQQMFFSTVNSDRPKIQNKGIRPLRTAHFSRGNQHSLTSRLVIPICLTFHTYMHIIPVQGLRRANVPTDKHPTARALLKLETSLRTASVFFREKMFGYYVSLTSTFTNCCNLAPSKCSSMSLQIKEGTLCCRS